MNEAQKNSNAQHFFLYLLTFFSLAFLSFGSGSILFQFVNKFLPDRIANNFDQGLARFGIAALFIAGPIFFVVSKIINKKISDGAIILESGVRKWLTYIVLFFAASTVIGDLIALVSNFLNGETTLQFSLKALIVLVIAGVIFSYYFWDMRKEVIDEKVAKINLISVSVCIFLLLVIFSGAFFIIDSPGVAREKRIDNQTLADMQATDASIRNFFNQVGTLPANLKDLERTGFSPYLQSGNKIDYETSGQNAYKLCGAFLRSNVNDKDTYYGPENVNEWKHQAGRICFERIALKENQEKSQLR